MDISVATHAKILIATDIPGDAEMIKQLLHPEFNHVFQSVDPKHSVSDFDQHRPDILVLAFNELEKSERYYLGLYRLSKILQQHLHRTVILCGQDEVKRVYDLCMKDFFDDYVLFWPMSFDATRVLMSIHNQFRELSILKNNAPTLAEFAAQARHLVELEEKLDQQMARGVRHIEASSNALVKAEHGIGEALDELSHRLNQPGKAGMQNQTTLENEISRFKHEEIRQHFNAAANLSQPLKQWAENIKNECEPQIESSRNLHAMAERIHPVILVVDDDEFQHKIISKILAGTNYQLIFASSGIQALSILRKTKPDVILMDIMMPEMDGMEVTRMIRTMSTFENTPVIMITGNSEGDTVVNSIKSGATDFLVKPFNRDSLIAKILHALNTKILPDS